jgi:anti-sigma B factor antagonist
MSLQFVVRRADGVVILDLLGKATIGGSNDRLSEQLRQLIDEGTTKLLVNLSDLTQVDSSSISTIVRALVSLKTRGGTLKLLRPRGNVKLALETLHLLDAIPSAEDESQAIASFS